MFKQDWAVALCAMAGAVFAQNPAEAQTIEGFAIDSPAGYTLAGEIQYADHIATPMPAIILVSGSGAQDRHADLGSIGYSAHRQWREIFNAAGFAVITFDETGTGESGGDWSQMGLAEHRDNALASVSHARADSRIDAGQIFALGHSEGGMIISMMSIEDANLAGLVYVAAPGALLEDVIDYQTEAMARSMISDESELPAAKARARERFMQMLNRAASLRDGLEYNALELAASVQAPAIVIQGEHDWQVRVEQAPALTAAIERSGQPVEMHVFQDVNHLLVNDPSHAQDYSGLTDLDLDPRLTASVVAWLARQTG